MATQMLIRSRKVLLSSLLGASLAAGCQDDPATGRPTGLAPGAETRVAGKADRISVVNVADLVRRQRAARASGASRVEDLRAGFVPAPMPVPHDLPVQLSAGKRKAGVPASGPGGPGRPGGIPRPSGPTPPGPASPPPTFGFQALDDNNAGIPPDTHGAVGPSHLVTTLNTEVLVQDRAGKQLARLSLRQFWTGYYVSRPFDPRVHYDPFAKRWITVAVADGRSADSALLVAVSQTSNPLGSWNRYRLDVDSSDTYWADYPNVGFNKDWIVVQANMFTVSGSSFSHSKIWVFDKVDMYAGGTGKHNVFAYSGIGGTHVPAITYDNTLSTLYLINHWSSSQGCLRMFTITGAVGSETLGGGPLVCASSAPWSNSGGTNFGPQLGSTVGIHTNDARMHRVVYRNGALWGAHSVFLPSGSPTRSAVQWWQITPAGAITQRGRIDDPTGKVHRAFPSLAVNKSNDVLIGYSRLSTTTYVGAAYSFRKGTDAANTVQSEEVFKAGEAPYHKDFGKSRNRWGDYSATVEDPLNDADMWTIQEYAAKPSGGYDRWATWWAGITVQKLANGVACKAGLQCQSGFCVDGVCCNSACGGGVATDCQACSVTAGALTNGTCAPLAAGKVCRLAAGSCDAMETCNGTAVQCPANGFLPSSTVCRNSAGVCDDAETCTGSSANCPADVFKASTAVCRAAAGVCDAAETCTGFGSTATTVGTQIIRMCSSSR